MTTSRKRRAIAAALLLCGGAAAAWLGPRRPSPLKLAPGWRIELVAEAPAILYPTAIVAAPDGTIYLGSDPMDMPGPPTEPIDSVLAIKDGRVTRYAEGLHAVMGLEWIDDTLYVVHAPFLSALRDTDGDGRADHRIDLVTGLGPTVPAFNGINDHIASGLRLGMDGFLYIAVGDKGIPRAVGADGATLRMRGGGVIRVRPDGTGLEVVSTGERNPLSVALDDDDEVFTFGNDDDSKRWPNSLTHHIVGGDHGYPYTFADAPERALPILDGSIGGAGAQGICYGEAGLGYRFRGDLFFCDWGRGAVIRYRVERSGGTHRVVEKEYIVRRGSLRDFRPFSLAVGDGGRCLYLVDWAFNGFLVDGPRTGRLYRLTHEGGRDRAADPIEVSEIRALDHPSRSVRLAAQRALTAARAEAPLLARLRRPDSGRGRIHALWALSAIGTDPARQAVRGAISDADEEVRTQAARAVGIARDPMASPGLIGMLGDPSARARREAAIALGRLGDPGASPALMAALGDTDRFVDWSIRRAIRQIGAWDVDRLREALREPRRRESALNLCDQAWAVPVVEALGLALDDADDPRWRARLVAVLAGLYRTEPEWSGSWWGANPLAGAFPRRTRDWDLRGMRAVLAGLSGRLRDPDAGVRRQAILGLIDAGPAGAESLRMSLDREADATNLAMTARALGELRDRASVPALVGLVRDRGRPLEVREAALAALPGPEGADLRLAMARDPGAPGVLAARAIAGLAGDDRLSAGELSRSLSDARPEIRAAALRALAGRRDLAPDVRTAIVARLDDPSDSVRRVAVEAAGALRLREAVPGLSRASVDAEDRPAAVRALAAIAQPSAAAVFLSAIEDRDPEVRRAGVLGLEAIRDDSGAELESALRSGRLSPTAETVLDRALTRFRPLREWRIVGPFPRNAPKPPDDPSSIDFARPLAGVEGRAVRWRTAVGEPTTGRIAPDDLLDGPRAKSGYDADHSPDLAADAYAEIVSPADREASLRIGSSGTITVSLDGRPVFHADHDAGRPYAPDSDVAPVVLRKGINRLLVRSRQGIGRWSFSVQVSEPRGHMPSASPRPPGGLPAYAMAHDGDPRRGEELFFDARGVGCARCHSAGGRGTARIGPDLSGLGLQYDRAEIVRSVLEPSSRIVNGYRPVILALADGSVASGLLRDETDDHLELVDATTRTIRVARSDIIDRRLGETSPMPVGLVDTLAPREFADLIAYLESLRDRPGSASKP